MKTLLSFVDNVDNIVEFLPALIMPIVFMIIVVVIIIVLVKKSKAAAKRQREINEQQSRMTDGNGRTEHQRDYLARLRVQQSERKMKELEHKQKQLESSMHAHGGKAEHYEPIVGSLGEVDDEGCDELDGVRLVEHDEAYCDDPEHFVSADMDELQRAIVLGEVLNNPRFVNQYKKK